ncbi:MAG: HAMP domain-containing sensor histidine kinase [Motiliproteus sp.]
MSCEPKIDNSRGRNTVTMNTIQHSIKQLRRNTALRMTLRFSLLFLLSAAALFITVDYLLERTQREKDQQQIGSFLESYQRLDAQVGLEKLEHVIERDAPYFLRSEMRVEVQSNQQRRLLVQPEHWQGKLQSINVDGDWQHIRVGDTHLLQRQIQLSDGSNLIIGKSTAERQQQLTSYRQLMLQVMLPLLLLGLLLTGYMNWRALLPLHDLIDTVRQLRANQLNARVTVRNPDSELGELAQLFNDMLAQIERLITAMSQSLDSVAHDLRTPLSRMRLSVESALSSPEFNTKHDSAPDETALKEVLKEALLDCAEESERIELMLKTLLDLTEAESGLLKLHPESIDLTKLAEQCLELYSYVAEEREVELSLEAPKSLLINGDPIRLSQVLANLLDNAIKYTQAGGKVKLSLQAVDNQILLLVQDNGIGIAATDQPLVFDRLFRADNSRSEPGMGLGLSLVKAVIEAHRGTIELDSLPQQGSCFTVLLPSQPQL